jgi:hypothetical protein
MAAAVVDAVQAEMAMAVLAAEDGGAVEAFLAGVADGDGASLYKEEPGLVSRAVSDFEGDHSRRGIEPRKKG